MGLFFLIFVIFIFDTYHQGQDFEVFWRASRAIIEGKSPYLIENQGGMVFKYPPWIASLFIPFGFISASQARLAWGIIEVSSLFLVFRWLTLQRINLNDIFIVFLSFWGVWISHVLDGQVVLPVLACTLWIWTSKSDRWQYLKVGVILILLSIKIFWVFSALGLFTSIRRSTLGLLSFGILAAILSLPVLWVTPDHSLYQLFENWIHFASSGETLIGYSKVYGIENQSFSALFIRIFTLFFQSSIDVVFISITLGLILGGFWWRYSRKLTLEESCAGWLALAPIIHPLAWVHSFVLVFPLAVLSLKKAAALKKRSMYICVLFAHLFMVFSSKNAFGILGESLSLLSARSFSVLLFWWVFSDSTHSHSLGESNSLSSS